MGRSVVALVVGFSCLMAVSRPVTAEERVPSLDAAESLKVTNGDTAGTLDEQGLPEPMRLSMEFQDANLKDILKVFSQQTGINVIAGSEVGDQAVTLYLESVTALDALDQILRVSNLTYERQPGSDIYIVQPKKDAGGSLTETRVYRLKYARVSKSNLAKAAAAFGESTPFDAALKLEGGDSTGESGSGGGGGGGGGKGAGDVGIDVVLKDLLTANGRISVDSRTNSLVITDLPANFPRLEAALAALDIRTPQIMIDAEIIETSLSKLKDLGVEWGTGAEGDVATFTPGSAGRQTRFPFNLFGEGIAPTTVPSAFPTSTLSFNSFKGVLQALESDSDTKILARPKVLTLDNESALIRLTTNQATGFTTSSQATTGSQSSKPERTTTGVVMVVTPQVNENNYITMLVEPSVTKVVASQISAPSGQATPIDPKTRSSRTVVRIRSGDTLVVGGLIDRSDKHSLRRVPVLSGIPFIGEAFKNTEVDDTASELIVFITPRILEEASEAQTAAVGQSPLGLREQESSQHRQESIEETLNQLEQPRL